MKTKQIADFVKKNKKSLLISLGVVVVLVVVWVIVRRKKGIDTKEKDLAEQNTGQSITAGINWRDLADRLRAAFSGPNASGTDEVEVYAVLGTLRNQADWEYLKRYWATYCGYRMGDPVLILRHQDLARRDTSKLEYTLQYVSEAWNRLGDEQRYTEILWEGFAFFPQSNYFFPRLMDNYTRKGNYELGLTVADEALKTDSLNELYLFAKSTMLLNLGRYAECLKYSDRLIAVNDQMADAYYNAGTACLNIVLNMDPRRHKKQIRKMYQKAQPYMENYRRLAPEAKDKWGPSLYRIYFNLNLGKQFDEIDRLLKGGSL